MGEGAAIRVKAGPHDRREAVVTFELDEAAPVAGLEPEVGPRPGKKSDHILPAQRDGRLVTFVLPRLKPGREMVLRTVARAPARLSKKSAVALADSKGTPDALAITIGGKLFSEYRYGRDLARPFMWPLAGPGETRMTRSWPMEERKGDPPRGGAPQRGGDSEDHVHHKGLWVAHGDVNSSDHWSEGKKHGWMTHRDFTKRVGGPVYAEFTARNVWRTRGRKPVCDEERTIRVMRLPSDARLVDLTVVFRATHGDVTFADTKEGGICSVRVPSTMEKRGLIENSYGGVGEAECWGRAAHWVDYSGKAGGKPPGGGRHRGIAIMDHPMNLMHPTRWHVRGYGLFAANPFALSYYKAGFQRYGPHTVPAGGELTFRYRVVLHKGNARDGKVASRYVDWITPPEVEVVGG